MFKSKIERIVNNLASGQCCKTHPWRLLIPSQSPFQNRKLGSVFQSLLVGAENL